jgi:hypothetical protein
MMMSVEKSVECLAGETEVVVEDMAPVPLCSPQIPRYLTRAAAVGSQPDHLSYGPDMTP